MTGDGGGPGDGTNQNTENSATPGTGSSSNSLQTNPVASSFISTSYCCTGNTACVKREKKFYSGIMIFERTIYIIVACSVTGTVCCFG